MVRVTLLNMVRRHNVSKYALLRHSANHMSRHTVTGLAAGKEIIAILNRAETAVIWNLTVLTIREARRYVEELMMLNLTVPASRAVRRMRTQSEKFRAYILINAQMWGFGDKTEIFCSTTPLPVLT
jgi:hypothetical protein